jgi:hypothetical protein
VEDDGATRPSYKIDFYPKRAAIDGKRSRSRFETINDTPIQQAQASASTHAIQSYNASCLPNSNDYYSSTSTLDEGIDFSHQETPFLSAMRRLEEAIERSRLVIEVLEVLEASYSITERRWR